MLRKVCHLAKHVHLNNINQAVLWLLSGGLSGHLCLNTNHGGFMLAWWRTRCDIFCCDLVLVKKHFPFFKRKKERKNRTPLKGELEKRKTFQVCLEGMRGICWSCSPLHMKQAKKSLSRCVQMHYLLMPASAQGQSGGDESIHVWEQTCKYWSQQQCAMQIT